jgi:hypothetical protein
MTVLANPKHERFAQELAKGKTATEAMRLAGIELSSCVSLAKFYVYVLIDPRTDIVFYVGKGCRNRADQHVGEWRRGEVINAEKFQRIGDIVRCGFRVQANCVVDGLEEAEAFDIERMIIKTVGRDLLTNVSSGSQTEAAKALAAAKDNLARTRAFCRWKLYISPQLVGHGHLSQDDYERLYWDVIGELSEMIAELEGRPYRHYPPMWRPLAGRAA